MSASTEQRRVSGDFPLLWAGQRTFLSPTEESAVLLQGVVDLDEASTGEELNDHPGGDDGGDTQLHERPSIRRQDDSHPVQRV